MACKGKVRYANEREAEVALRRVREAQIATHAPARVQRAYPCRSCRGWHLTSSAT